MEGKIIYKTIDLFGNEEIQLIEKKKTSNKTLFTDYEGFVDKFKIKKTTDDCNTPKEVIQIIINYVNDIYPLKNSKIIRPFYPGGDYKSINYPSNAIVIDNPPFSIITKICRYYIKKNIRFFLFAPHLTAFTADIDATHIIASADITYENGAKIKTSFISNLFKNEKIIGDAELNKKFKELEKRHKANLPKYKYPNHIITVSKIGKIVEKGISITLNKKEVKHYRRMDAQKKHGKTLYGGGFIVSDKAAAAAAAAAKVKDNKIIWELSARERGIIKSLGDY